jgi:hypothetical protein
LNDNYNINIGAIRYKAHQRWLSEQRKRVNFLERVDQSVPWWLVIIAATLFALSAPHTAHTFNQLTPGAGLVAPLAVEFGLLYAAFRRKKYKVAPRMVIGLEIFLFITAIIVNGAGSFSAVVSSANLSDLPFGEMIERFGHLPATSQVALALVPIAALIIPIGTAVAGDGLASLITERRETTVIDADVKWAEAAPGILYEAFFDALVTAGCTPGKAKRLASAYAHGIAENAGMTENSGTNAEKDKLGKGEARQRLDLLLRDDPTSVHLPVERLMELTGAGKSAVYEWRAANKYRLNGHGEPKE